MTTRIGVDIEADVSGLNQGFAQAEQRTEDFTGAVRKSTAVLGETSAAAARLLDTYDPLSAQLRKLKGDFATLNEAARGGGISGRDDGRLDAAYVALQQEIKQTEAAMASMGTIGPASLGKVQMSAKATAAAMRGVPAQFTDIFTSLQMGQSPMQVFLQQGGQLKDMFGGVGAAARALGSYVLGLVNPFTVAAVAAGILGKAWYDGSEESETFAKTLIITGNAAGTSAGQMMDAARRVRDATGATQGAAAEVLDQLLQTGEVGAASLDKVAQAALDLERVGVASAETIVKEFAELGNDPVRAAERLNEKYHFLTVAVYDQIRALQEQGREDDAAALAQNALADELDARARRIKDSLGLVERGWIGIKDSAKSAWDAMLDIGREDSLTQQLAKAEAELQKIIAARNGKNALGSSKAREDLGAGFGNEAELRLKIEGLKEEIALTDKLSQTQVAGNREVEAAIKKANERVPKAASSAKNPGDDYEKLMNRLSGLDANYSRDLNTLYSAYQQGKLGVDDYRIAVEKLIAKQPFAMAAAKEEQRALQEQQKILDATTQAEERAGKAATEFAVKTADRVEAIARQIELLGKSPDEAAQINAFADIDRQADALLKKLEELRANVLAKGGDTSGIDDMLAKLPQLADYAKGKAAEALGKLKDAQDDLNASWEYGADEALRKYLDEVGNVAAQSEKLVSNSFKGMEDALSEFVKTGKLDFSSLADSIISDLIRMQIKANITGPLAGMMQDAGGIGGFFSGLFGGGSSASADTSGIGTAMSLMNSLHTGGIVGSNEGSGLRAVSPAVFNNAPRFHTGGIAGDEVPILAKRGEGVFTEGQMQAMGNAKPPVVNVNIIGASSQPTTQTRQNGSGGMDIDVIFDQIESKMAANVARGGGSLGPSMERTYGLGRAPSAY